MVKKCMIQDFIGSPNSAVKEKETEMKGGVWRRLSASPFGLTLGPKSPPSFILFIIKLIFSCPSDKIFCDSDLRQTILT